MMYFFDLHNVPEDHIVFHDSCIYPPEQCRDASERKKWDRDIRIISRKGIGRFTNSHLCVHGPINGLFNYIPYNGVVFENNLFFHKIDQMMDFGRLKLPNFEKAIFVPQKMTEIIQVADGSIHIQYISASIMNKGENCPNNLRKLMQKLVHVKK